MKIFLLILMTVFFLFYLIVYVIDTIKYKNELKNKNIPGIPGLIAGLIVNLLDVLGIGSFATSTSFFRYSKYVKNIRYYPGTLNVMATPATYLQAIIFVTIVKVDFLLIFFTIIFTIIGSILGTKIAPKVKKSVFKIVIGASLLLIVILMCIKQFGIISALQSDNTAVSLNGPKLIIMCIVMVIAGILGAFGVGAYSICIVATALLGLSPIVAWPIMSSTGLIKVVTTGAIFIKQGSYKRKQALFMSIGGVFGVIIGALILTHVNIIIFVWLAILIIFITGIHMLLDVVKQNH